MNKITKFFFYLKLVQNVFVMYKKILGGGIIKMYTFDGFLFFNPFSVHSIKYITKLCVCVIKIVLKLITGSNKVITKFHHFVYKDFSIFTC